MATMAASRRLIRVARDASSAARHAAARVASAASSRPEASSPACRAARSPRSRAIRRRDDDDDSCPRPLPRGDHVPGWDVTDKDLESDEAIWTLYENWCKVYNMERGHEEMARRFSTFKEVAKLVHTFDGRLGFAADGKEKLDERGLKQLLPFEVPNRYSWS